MILPPIPEVTLFGLTTLTIEGGPAPGFVTGMPCPLFDKRMILLPVEVAAATAEVETADVVTVFEATEVTEAVEGAGARIYMIRLPA